MTARPELAEPRTASDSAAEALLEALPLPAAVIDCQGRIASVNRPWRTLFADAPLPWDDRLPGDPAVERLSAALRDVLAGRSAGFAGDFRLNGPRGRRDLVVRLTPLRRYAGPAALAVCEDATELRQARGGRDAHLALTRIFTGSARTADAYPGVLEAVCRGLDWDFGEIWTAEGTPAQSTPAGTVAGEPTTLTCSAIWHRPDAGLQAFADASCGMSLAWGAGLPGRVAASGRPEWVVDLTAAPDFRRREAAGACGLRSAAAFAIRGPHGPVGVFVFFTRSRRLPEPETAAVMEDIGSRTGLFIVRHSAEGDLRDAKAFYESLVETLPHSIYRTDLQGRLTFGNSRYCERLGRPLAGLVGKTVFDLFPEELAAKYAADDRRVLESARPIEETEAHVAEDGRPLVVQVVKTPVRDSDGRVVGIQGLFWDITERTRLEDDLRRRTADLERANRELAEAQSQLVAQERLAALGHLTAGVAHEFNSPLAFLNNNLAVIRRDVELVAGLLLLHRRARTAGPDERTALHAEIDRRESDVDAEYTVENLSRLLASCRKGLERVAKIVADLRGFSRLDRAEFDEADLDEAVEQTIGLLAYELGRKSIVPTRSYGGLQGIPCRPAKLNQVFLNILLNAVQASPEGAPLWVTTSRRGEEAVVEVRDQGCGMTEDVRRRVFDPFYTTKPVGTGTGLGLSIAYSIVREHGGRIEVESQPGAGSVFRVILPAAGGGTPMPS